MKIPEDQPVPVTGTAVPPPATGWFHMHQSFCTMLHEDSTPHGLFKWCVHKGHRPTKTLRKAPLIVCHNLAVRSLPYLFCTQHHRAQPCLPACSSTSKPLGQSPGTRRASTSEPLGIIDGGFETTSLWASTAGPAFNPLLLQLSDPSTALGTLHLLIVPSLCLEQALRKDEKENRGSAEYWTLLRRNWNVLQE